VTEILIFKTRPPPGQESDWEPEYFKLSPEAESKGARCTLDGSASFNVFIPEVEDIAKGFELGQFFMNGSEWILLNKMSNKNIVRVIRSLVGQVAKREKYAQISASKLTLKVQFQKYKSKYCCNLQILATNNALKLLI